jgi:hypothetical protein
MGRIQPAIRSVRKKRSFPLASEQAPGPRSDHVSQGLAARVLAMQRTIGNSAVQRLVERGSIRPGLIQRTPDDVYRLIFSFQGRLRKGPGIDAAALQILTEITQFHAHFTDQPTRAELATRARMILADWNADPDLQPETKKEAQRVLTPLQTPPPQQPAAVAAPAAKAAPTPATQSAPTQTAPAKAVAAPQGAPQAAAKTPTALTKTMKAFEVHNCLAGGTATATGLQVKWYETNDDKSKKQFSTAYNVGKDTNWEIHVHRKNNNGQPVAVTVQQKAAVGNTGATRGMELDASKLDALGIPKNHDPRKAQGYNQWASL